MLFTLPGSTTSPKGLSRSAIHCVPSQERKLTSGHASKRSKSEGREELKRSKFDVGAGTGERNVLAGEDAVADRTRPDSESSAVYRQVSWKTRYEKKPEQSAEKLPHLTLRNRNTAKNQSRQLEPGKQKLV